MLYGISLTVSTAHAADAEWYVRRATWLDSLLDSREALVRLEADEAAQAAARRDGPALGPWWSIGPFFAPQGERAFGIAFPPEQGVDLTARYRDGKLSWTPRPAWRDGVVIDLPPGDHSATYLYRTITAAAPCKLTVYLGSDDGCELFCNGAKVLSRDVPRVSAPNQEQVELDLRAGENQLLFKIVNLTGGHSFYFSTDPVPGDAASKRRAELWRWLERDFPADRVAIGWEREDGIWEEDWPPGQREPLAERYRPRVRGAAWQARAAAVRGLPDVRAVYLLSRRAEAAAAKLTSLNLEAVLLAIDDLIHSFGDRYARGREFRDSVERAGAAAAAAMVRASAGDPAAVAEAEGAVDALDRARSEALLANPLLDFDRLLLVRRRGNLGLPANWQGNSSLGTRGYDNELMTLSPVRPDGELTSLYRPESGRFVGDLDLHPDASRLLFSMPDDQDRWQVYELDFGAGAARQITPGDQPDVHAFDGCYLPDGRIVFCSTACFQGVPCVNGGDKVSLLYLLDPSTGSVRQLTFDQDHSWDPTVLNNGRVLYTRWEYSDTPHYFTRLLFSMNPDGTSQMEYYGSNSYWPNSTFYARAIPGEPTKVVAIVSGHHGERRAGELVIFDPARGRHEASGVVQRIPGRGRVVEPVIADQLVDPVWPKFLHPAPLSAKYFLVACKRSPEADWAIVLADVFDNLVTIRELPGHALLEPVPLRPKPAPPVIPDKVRLDRPDAIVYLADIYAGDGLRGVPRGTVKRLRLLEQHFAYNQMGGHLHVGVDGPWDVKRILGTVPVEEDGSALFRVPANTPISVQPLDSSGMALQVMRSWMTAMPGETLSCVGCHEPLNGAPPLRRTMAAGREPSPISPWYGPPRGFSFKREVQPVLDRYCIGCHGAGATLDLRDTGAGFGGFDNAYLALHPFVRRPGPESDYHLLPPLEFHADTSPLVQLLRKGHQGVRLDADSWSRLITWIDLNVPCHGTWHEHQPVPGGFDQRRRTLKAMYAGVRDDPEAVPELPPPPTAPSVPEILPTAVRVDCPSWPFDTARAREMQAALGDPITVDLGDGVVMTLVPIPAGEFVMGDPDGEPDERPLTRVRIERPFWLGATEVTNEQYARFDPHHDSGVISETNKDQTRRGVPVNGPRQPVVRVSQRAAQAFCHWLGERVGAPMSLPTEAQWEWACRAGSDGPTWYGGLDTDFSPFANLADRSLAALARRDSPKWLPRDDRFDDGATATQEVGRSRPNPWGLYDMHGNAAEWTRTLYRPYPYAADGRDDPGARGRVVVRGGSWYDRPRAARSAARLDYADWQAVYNVGFRVCGGFDAMPQRLAGRLP